LAKVGKGLLGSKDALGCSPTRFGR